MRLFQFLGALGVSVLAVSAAQAGPLIPGALVACGFGENNQFIQYSTAGAVLDTFSVSGALDNPHGIALIGGILYAADGSGRLYTVNPLTGVATFAFDVPDMMESSLGNIGGDLLALDEFGSVARCSTGGGLLGSFPVTVGGVGVDSDGTDIFVANAFTAAIERYSNAGAFLDSFPSGAGEGALSSLAYDSDTDTLWVGASNEFGNPRIMHLTKTGTLLGSFSVGQFRASGLEYIPATGGAAAPEPGTLALLALGVMSGLATHRRK